MAVNVKDIGAGLVFICIAAAFAITSLDYDLGSAFRMGPAYFPRLLAGLLALFGVVILVNGFRGSGTPIGQVPGRGLLLVMLAPIAFGLTVRGLGFVPAIAIVALFGALASRKTTPLGAIMATGVLTVACYLIFIRGLGVPLPLFGPWLGA